MNCPKCNSYVKDGTSFCSECGFPLNSAAARQQPQYQQPQYQQPQCQQPQYQQPQYQQPQYQQPQYQQPQYRPQAPVNNGGVPEFTYAPDGRQIGMNWFKFIIYFQLFLSCVVNVYNGIQMMSGGQYKGMAELVYNTIKGMKGIDIVFGLLFIVLGVAAIVVRFQMSGFKKQGPVMYMGFCAAVCLVSLAYIIAVKIIVSKYTDDTSSLNSASIVQLISTGVMLAVNIPYFKNRQHLFVN